RVHMIMDWAGWGRRGVSGAWLRNGVSGHGPRRRGSSGPQPTADVAVALCDLGQRRPAIRRPGGESAGWDVIGVEQLGGDLLADVLAVQVLGVVGALAREALQHGHGPGVGD